jgi:hypothetical protein
VKQQNKEVTNAEISKILSNMWKKAPDALKKEYSNQEAIARTEYKKTEWRIEKEKQEEFLLELFQENELERQGQVLPKYKGEKNDYGRDGEHHVTNDIRVLKGDREERWYP